MIPSKLQNKFRNSSYRNSRDLLHLEYKKHFKVQKKKTDPVYCWPRKSHKQITQALKSSYETQEMKFLRFNEISTKLKNLRAHN